MYKSIYEFCILKLLNIQCIPSRAPRVIFVLWQPPPFFWIKVNTDGSFFGTTGAAGAGGIFRTSARFPRGAFAFGIENAHAYLAELSATVYAIEIASEKGWKNLWLECDSLWAVTLFRKLSHDVPWKLLHKWINCLHLISHMNFKVSHIFREGNQVADCLAKYGVLNPSPMWWSSAPSFCLHPICSDFCK